MILNRDSLFNGIALLAFCSVSGSFAQTTNAPAQTNALQAEMQAAIHQVEKIVNQPVTAYRRAPGMNVGKFEGGWFHPGASKPDFNNADVRKTQESAIYDKYEYSTSDLNPGVVWPSKQLEFNSMTKYFYTNRNVPKKRLTEAEMEEINRLYRIIGRCERELRHLQNPALATAQVSSETAPADSAESTGDASTSAKRPRLLNPYIGGGAILFLVLLVAVNYMRRRGQ